MSLVEYFTYLSVYNNECTVVSQLSVIEALIRHLETSGIKHNILKDQDSNRLKDLFIACPESIQYLQSHHDVLLIDNTYSTNRFNMPLMDVIG
jgi:hypothetical protein